MRAVIVTAILACAAGLTACDDPAYEREDEVVVAEPMAPPAPAAEDVAAPATATTPPPAQDTTALPADKRSSEESVEPESETLFY